MEAFGHTLQLCLLQLNEVPVFVFVYLHEVEVDDSRVVLPPTPSLGAGLQRARNYEVVLQNNPVVIHYGLDLLFPPPLQVPPKEHRRQQEEENADGQEEEEAGKVESQENDERDKKQEEKAEKEQPERSDEGVD